jgi:hypothetical protein
MQNQESYIMSWPPGVGLGHNKEDHFFYVFTWEISAYMTQVRDHPDVAPGPLV